MIRFSPKKEIINHFDNLINIVDIDIEESLSKYTEDRVLGGLRCFRLKNRKGRYYRLEIGYVDSNESIQTNNSDIEWSKKSTKVIDYLNQIRQRTIDQLRKAQNDSLEYLKSKSCDLDHIKESKDVEEMKSRLFANKFYFQLVFKPRYERKNQKPWVFNSYIIVVDFYLSPSDLKFLDVLINAKAKEISKFIRHQKFILDEKHLLIQSICENFWLNLKTRKYPNQLINIRKQDLLNIKEITDTNRFMRELNLKSSSNYLSNLESINHDLHHLENVNIEGISSIKYLSLRAESIENVSFGNLNSLKRLILKFKSEINNGFITKLFEMCPNIENLFLDGKNSTINLDRNLKKLSLYSVTLDDFNYDLFENIDDLEINNMNISKLLCGRNFSSVKFLVIWGCNKITRLEKRIFDGFPILESLNVIFNSELKTIEKEAFSNLKNLRNLGLVGNDLSELNPELFSSLVNLKELFLRYNKLTHFDLKIMDYIVNIKEIHLVDNPIGNKEEILNRFKHSEIKIVI